MDESTSKLIALNSTTSHLRPCLTLAVSICALFMLSACYTVKVSLHHNDLMNTRRRIEDVLDDPKTAPATRASLHTVKRVLAHAQTEGLNAKGAYGYYIDLDRGVVSFLVQAAQADRLEPVTWWFPVVGRVPYLGYFNADERDAQAELLSAEGYDVHRGAAGAFSSLGWFDDPIFSSMLRRSTGDLAHLLFHELTHRTVWIPGSTAFNENLAEYVGEVLARDYLARYGTAAELTRYEKRRTDRRAFQAWLTNLRADLRKAYRRLAQADKATILKEKEQVFARHIGPFKPDFAVVDYVAGVDWNNASVLGASLYAPDMSRFARAQSCAGGRVFDLLRELEQRVSRKTKPDAALDAICATQKTEN